MRVMTAVRFGAIVGALALAACGGSGSSEFASKVQESCEKAPEGKTVDCACVAKTIDAELDDKTKAVMLAIEKASNEGKSPMDAMKDAGVAPEEAPALMQKLTPALQKAQEACVKK